MRPRLAAVTHSGLPRVVVLGDGAGLGRVVSGLAAHLCGGHQQHDWLTAIVPSAGDTEHAESLVGHWASVLPATEDAGPVRRAYPESLRRIINADLIVCGPCDRATLDGMFAIGGIGSTLPAVNAVRVLVTTPSAERPSGQGDVSRLLSAPGLFDYWLSGSPAPAASDALIDDLHTLLVIAHEDGSPRDRCLQPPGPRVSTYAGRGC